MILYRNIKINNNMSYFPILILKYFNTYLLIKQLTKLNWTYNKYIL